MHRREFVLTIIILLCFAVGTALAADALTGTWKLNLAKSKYSPGPPPKSGTNKVEAMEGGFKFTNDAVDATGKATHNEWSAKFDGKDNPVKGDPTRDMASLKKIDDYTYEVTSKKAGKVTTTNRIVVSRDGKSSTRTITGTDSEGRKVNNTQVYDKQ